jgi:hypothetical protein
MYPGQRKSLDQPVFVQLMVLHRYTVIQRGRQSSLHARHKKLEDSDIGDSGGVNFEDFCDASVIAANNHPCPVTASAARIYVDDTA